MIRVHTTGLEGERFLKLDEVNIHTQKIDYNGAPYILFEHKDSRRFVECFIRWHLLGL